MTQAKRPTKAEIATEALIKQIFVTGPADVNGLRQVCAAANESDDRAAEAIARFGLGNFLDGNVPGVEKLDHRGAIDEFTRALELYPAWPEAKFNRGIAHVHAGQYSEAIADFDEAEPLFLEGVSRGGSLASAQDRMLLGKLCLFRGEARAKRREGDDLQRAREDINQAQSLFLLSTPSARYWLEQIPERRRAVDEAIDETLSGSTSRTTATNAWFSFFWGFGAIAVALLILLLFIVFGASKPETEREGKKAALVQPSHLASEARSSPLISGRTATLPPATYHLSASLMQDVRPCILRIRTR